MVAPAAKGVLFVIKLRPPYSPSALYSVTPAGSPVTKMLKDGTVSEPLLVTLSVCVQSPVSKSSPVSEPAGKLEGVRPDVARSSVTGTPQDTTPSLKVIRVEEPSTVVLVFWSNSPSLVYTSKVSPSAKR